MTGEKESVPPPPKRVLVTEMGRRRWRRPTRKLRRRQIPVWAKMQGTRTHQGLRKKTKCSRMGIASQMKRASVAKPTPCRPASYISLQVGANPKLSVHSKVETGRNTCVETNSFSSYEVTLWASCYGAWTSWNARCYPNSPSSEVCVSMVAVTLVMQCISVCQEHCREIEHQRCRVELSLKTRDEHWRLLQNASYWILYCFTFLKKNWICTVWWCAWNLCRYTHSCKVQSM